MLVWINHGRKTVNDDDDESIVDWIFMNKIFTNRKIEVYE